MTQKIWTIICEQGAKNYFSSNISNGIITEEGIVRLIKTLISKYALTDDEILEQHLRRNSRRYRNYIKIERYQSFKNGKIYISYSADVSSFHVYAYLKEL